MHAPACGRNVLDLDGVDHLKNVDSTSSNAPLVRGPCGSEAKNVSGFSLQTSNDKNYASDWNEIINLALSNVDRILTGTHAIEMKKRVLSTPFGEMDTLRQICVELTQLAAGSCLMA